MNIDHKNIYGKITVGFDELKRIFKNSYKKALKGSAETPEETIARIKKSVNIKAEK